MLDYNQLLVLGIWVFFASGLLLFMPPGRGVVYLGPRQTRIRFPSWRTAFGSRLALALYPVHTFWPMAEVQLFAQSRPEALAELESVALQLSRSIGRARPFLAATTIVVVVAIPLWVLCRSADLIFLAMAAVAYLLYAVSIGVLVSSGVEDDRRRARAEWRTLLEPLLCLPYGAHLYRKLSARYGLTVPLIDVLQSEMPLPAADLRDLRERLAEQREIADDPAELIHLSQLEAQIDRRLGEFAQ